jgi:hypothetical protein
VIIVPLMVVLNAGVVVDAHALHGVAQQISRAKQADPDAFHALARLRERLADLDDVEADLEHLGPRGLWPMVEMIGFDAAPRGQFADGVWLSWQTSLIEAAGALRDRRAAPVFEAVLRSDNQPFAVYRAAAQALARVSDEAGASALINLSHGDGLKQDAILAGMGASTRPAVAHALVAELNAHPNPTRAAHVIEGLSELGNVGGNKDDERTGARRSGAGAGDGVRALRRRGPQGRLERAGVRRRSAHRVADREREDARRRGARAQAARAADPEAFGPLKRDYIAEAVGSFAAGSFCLGPRRAANASAMC